MSKPAAITTRPVHAPIVGRAVRPAHAPIARQVARKDAVRQVATATRPPLSKPDAIITRPAHAPIAQPVQKKVFLQQDSVLKPFEGNDLFEDSLFEDDPLLDVFNQNDETAGSVQQATTFACAACGQLFQLRDAYPQNNSEWATEDDGHLRCGPCFDKRSREEYVPTLEQKVTNEQTRAEKRAAKLSGKKVGKNGPADKEVGKNGPQKPKKPKKKRACKCGATSPRMVTSRLCPMNKKYNRFEANKLAVKRRAMAGAAMRRANATAGSNAGPKDATTTGATTEVKTKPKPKPNPKPKPKSKSKPAPAPKLKPKPLSS